MQVIYIWPNRAWNAHKL